MTIQLKICRHKASEKITDLITNTKFCNDISHLSPLHQTSSVEAFHSVMIHFLPKSTAFSYKGMFGRLGHTCSDNLILLTLHSMQAETSSFALQ